MIKPERNGSINKCRIKIGGHVVNNLRYTNEAVLIAENKEDLQQLLDSSKKELDLKSKKAVVGIISYNSECPQITIFVNGNKPNTLVLKYQVIEATPLKLQE